MAKTYDVKVKVPKREHHAGFWSAQQHFASGVDHNVTVNGKQLRDLLNDDKNGFLMVEDAESLRKQVEDDPDAGNTPTTTVTVTAEEQAALESFRRQKAAGQATVQVPVNPNAPHDPTKQKDKGGK